MGSYNSQATFAHPHPSLSTKNPPFPCPTFPNYFHLVIQMSLFGFENVINSTTHWDLHLYSSLPYNRIVQTCHLADCPFLQYNCTYFQLPIYNPDLPTWLALRDRCEEITKRREIQARCKELQLESKPDIIN